MRKLLSYQVVRSAKPGPKEYEIHDSELKGFFLRVFPSGQKRYYIQIARGKRKVVGDTSLLVEQARDKAATLKRTYTDGTPANNGITLNQFIRDNSIKTDIKRLMLCFPDLMDIPMEDINASDMEKWRQKRINAGREATTVNRDVADLKSVLTRAVRFGDLAVHPLAKLLPLKQKDNHIERYLSDDELKRLRESLNSCDSQLANIVTLALHTGMRRGEMFNLKWADIDFKRSQLTVQASGTKTGKRRYIALNATALNMLNQRKEQYGGEGLVFIGRYGGRLVDIKKSWVSLLKAARIESFRFHDLRHHFASSMVMEGVPLNTVRELMGHADIKMTLRYAHLAPENKAEAVRAIEW
ncbi:site-specific integrase [Gammaproteobacteria bacterium]|nr:site-specific integrase [Gammaproteobacteria bacterium]